MLNELISGTASGIAAAAFLAVFLIVTHRVRNWRLERELRRGFARGGVGIGDDFLSMVVENRLALTVRVRTIMLVGARGQGILELTHRRSVSQSALLNALGQASSPARISVAARLPAEPYGETGPTLTGFSGGLWGVSSKEVQRTAWSIEDAWMVLEYPTFFGGSAFLRIHFDAPTLRLVRQAIADIHRGAAGGQGPSPP